MAVHVVGDEDITQTRCILHMERDPLASAVRWVDVHVGYLDAHFHRLDELPVVWFRAVATRHLNRTSNRFSCQMSKSIQNIQN